LLKYTQDFEGMTLKEVVVMDEQILKARGVELGVAAVGARGKVFRTLEVVRWKVDIDHLTASSHRHRIMGLHLPCVCIVFGLVISI
jgi:hypothetical protein